MSEATKRATMPTGTSAVLDRRSVYYDNRNLLTIVKKGDRVLDVGCGTGAITIGISELAGEKGFVMGIDSSLHLIEAAIQNYASTANLHFELADINTYAPVEKFNVVTAARVLQWLANPEEVLNKMAGLLKDGGCVTILDYNHEKIEWTPAIPASMQVCYEAFLQWRKDAGMDNCIADHLEVMFRKAGLQHITVTEQFELSQRADAAFAADASIWLKVTESRGKQLVADGYITEQQRLQAIEDYTQWIENEGQSMRMYLLAVTGYK